MEEQLSWDKTWTLVLRFIAKCANHYMHDIFISTQDWASKWLLMIGKGNKELGFQFYFQIRMFGWMIS